MQSAYVKINADDSMQRELAAPAVVDEAYKVLQEIEAHLIASAQQSNSA